MTAYSDTSIANIALTKMGANRITSLTQDSKEARALNSIFASTRDAELRRHSWKFAIKRVTLSATTTTPEFGYSYEYLIPSDFIRLLTIGDYYITSETIGVYYREYHGAGIEKSLFEVEGQSILTDLGGPLKVRYIFREDDPQKYDPLFIDALACKLAFDTCADIIDASPRDVARLDEMYKQSIRDARRLNALERPPQKRATGTFIASRR